jgi:hypothetical protein
VAGGQVTIPTVAKGSDDFDLLSSCGSCGRASRRHASRRHFHRQRTYPQIPGEKRPGGRDRGLAREDVSTDLSTGLSTRATRQFTN